MNKPTLFAFSGLGADKRVFKNLQLDCNFIPVEWIKPFNNEKLKDYSLRIAEKNRIGKDDGVLGLSFGGLVAGEISRALESKITILVSSVEAYQEIPWIYRFFGSTGITQLLPHQFSKPPQFFAQIMFKPKNKQLLKAIIKDTDPVFSKWAIHQLTTWKNEDRISNCYRIHGSKDLVLPAKGNSKIIEGAGHFMISDESQIVSSFINEKIKTLYNSAHARQLGG